MFLQNSLRARNDRLNYKFHDTYSMPEYLRQVREKYKNYGLPITEQSSESILNYNPEIDDEDLLPMMSNTDIMVMAYKRLCCPVGWFIGKIPAKMQKLRIHEGVRRLIGFQNHRVSNLDVEDEVWNSEGSIELMDMVSCPYSMGLNTTDGSGRDEFYETKYGDTFRVVEISVESDDADLENFLAEYKDFQSMILHEGCASLIWVMNAQTRILLITESPEPNKWTPQQLYRRILSDIGLTDSILIGHPYYWHPVIRKKLRRAVRQMRKLYATIDRLENKGSNHPDRLPRVQLESYSDSNGTRTGTFNSLECSTQVKVKTERKRSKSTSVSVCDVKDSIIDAWYRRNHETRFPEAESSDVSAGVAMAKIGCSSETCLDPNIYRGSIDNRSSLSKFIPDFQDLGSRHHFELEIHSRSEDRTVGADTSRRKHRSKRKPRNDDRRDLTGENMAEHPSPQSPRATSTTTLDLPGCSRCPTEPEASPNLNANETEPSTSRNNPEAQLNPTAASSEWGDQDVNYEKLGLSRTRHSRSQPTVNQDQIPGPPGPNFNEPNAMPGAAIRVNMHHDGIHDLPPADADSSNPLRAIQRQFSSTDNLSGVVDQLGLETRMSSHSGHGHVDPQPHRHGSGPVFHDPQRSQNEISQNKYVNSLDLDSSSGSRFSHKSIHKSQPPEGDGF